MRGEAIRNVWENDSTQKKTAPAGNRGLTAHSMIAREGGSS